MHKIIWLLLIVLFVSGCDYEIVSDNATGGSVVCNKPYIQVGMDCCLDRDDNNVCDKDEDVEKLDEGNNIELPEENNEEPEEEPPVEKPEEETEKTVFMKTGDSTIFNGKDITLREIDLSQTLRFIIDVDGVERELHSTKNTEIVNGIKVTALNIDSLKKVIEIKFENLVLGPNEYLIDTHKDIFAYGKEVRLRDINDKTHILIDIVGGPLKNSIREGFTEEISGIKVGNVQTFFRNSLSEKYAIINLTKA